jgi:hypothetical protein
VRTIFYAAGFSPRDSKATFGHAQVLLEGPILGYEVLSPCACAFRGVPNGEISAQIREAANANFFPFISSSFLTP